VNLRKYLVLAAVAVFAAAGDVCLARGMRDFGAVSRANIGGLIPALLNPWIVLGVALLILFFASYLAALSWADLTFVLPATAVSYIFMALLAQQLLHEHVTGKRWLGVALITVGVGVVAGGPVRTTREQKGLTSETEQTLGAVGGSR